jgi:hypothetical protein
MMLVELDRCRNARYTVLLDWDRDKETQILLVFLVQGENAGDAFRHPFRYAP